ncbi:hypothetical protein K505DRAFT_328237 [Melanomma pulvis-pyrius CBS 109.77]|uniref:Uncharacterized protein n=1 Tax=Melanomma pulvis-pyrius CBS 109.77 TaxID=1314802 RepID=A0A6A6WZS2_9PLEO|nr:hypothetical protein K505DRAFT_328237 [Melanomma pulvis-pyrius CBS 109.77]
MLLTAVREGRPKIPPEYDVKPIRPLKPLPVSAFRADHPQVWTVDFDQERVFLDRENLHLVHPCSRYGMFKLRIERFEPYTPADLPPWKPTQLHRCWTLPDVIPQQLFDLVYRLVSDYYRSWYGRRFSIESPRGLQQLGFGLLSCLTLNFKTTSWHPDTFNSDSWPWETNMSSNLLRWRTWPTPPVVPTIDLGRVVIIFTARLEDAARLVQTHYMQAIGKTTNRPSPFPDTIYVVTTLRALQVFKKTQTTTEATFAVSFLYDDGTLSPVAVRWFLNAIHGHGYPLTTQIHRLPIEIQELILENASTCDIDRAVYASILGIGVPFNWKSGNIPLKHLELLNIRHINGIHPEQRLMFWGEYMGLSYQPDSGG